MLVGPCSRREKVGQVGPHLLCAFPFVSAAAGHPWHPVMGRRIAPVLPSVITGHTLCEGVLCPDSPLLRTPVVGLRVHSAIMAPLNLTPSKVPICIKSHSLIPRVRTSPLGGKEAGVLVTVLPKTAPISGKDDGSPLWLLT